MTEIKAEVKYFIFRVYYLSNYVWLSTESIKRKRGEKNYATVNKSYINFSLFMKITNDSERLF